MQGACAADQTWRNLRRPTNDPQLMSYRSYLDSFLLPFRSGAGPDVERHNTDVKNRRQALKRKFTEPGEPGRMFRRGARARERRAVGQNGKQWRPCMAVDTAAKSGNAALQVSCCGDVRER